MTDDYYRGKPQIDALIDVNERVQKRLKKLEEAAGLGEPAYVPLVSDVEITRIVGDGDEELIRVVRETAAVTLHAAADWLGVFLPHDSVPASALRRRSRQEAEHAGVSLGGRHER